MCGIVRYCCLHCSSQLSSHQLRSTRHKNPFFNTFLDAPEQSFFLWKICSENIVLLDGRFHSGLQNQILMYWTWIITDNSWTNQIYHSNLPFEFTIIQPAREARRLAQRAERSRRDRRLLHRNGTFAPPDPSTRTRWQVKTDFRQKTGHSRAVYELIWKIPRGETT